MKETTYKDEDYQLAIKNRYGLDNKEDIKQAKIYFKKLFRENNPEAGLYLAKLHEKDGEINFAKEIYEKLLTDDSQKTINKDSSNISDMALFYTKYKKLRLNEKEIWNAEVELQDIQRSDQNHIKKSKALEDKIADLIKSYNEFEEEINIGAISPDIKQDFLNKIYYHRGILKIKRVELYDENIQEFNDFKSLGLIENSEEIEKDIPKYIEKRDEIYESANNDLKEAANNNYKKARAELINIEIKQKLKKKQELLSNDIHHLIRDAKKIDPKNINTRLLEVNYLLGIKINKDGNKSRAQNLLNEILEKEPKNPHALRYKKILKQEMINRLTKSFINNLDSKISELNIKGLFSFLTENKFLNSKKEYLSKVEDLIYSRLEKDQFIENANFAFYKDIERELLRDDIINPLVRTPEQLSSKKLVSNKEIINAVDDKISTFINRLHENHLFIIANPDLNSLGVKLLKFKERLLDGLMSYYDRCMALKTYIPADVPIKLNIDNENKPSAFDEARKVMMQGAILQLSSTLFSPTAAIASTIALTSASYLYKLSGEDQEKALKAGADKFLTIGDSSNFISQSKESKRAEAKKKLEYLCNKIISKHGMQLGRVSDYVADEACDITQLADYTLQKMLVRIHDSCPSYQQMFLKYLNPQNITSRIFNFSPKIEKDPISILEDGLINGSCLADTKIINLEGESKEKWIVGEIFAAPGLSPDGESIYTKIGQKPDVYGVIEASEIPSDFTKVELSSFDKEMIKESWTKHKAIEDVIIKTKSEELMLQETKTKLLVNNEKDLKQKEKVRSQRDLYVATALFGGVSLLTSGIIAMANALGTSALIFGAAAAAVGVATTTLVPAIIAGVAIIGVCSIYYGAKGAKNKSNELKMIENRTDYPELAIREVVSDFIKKQNSENKTTPVTEKGRLSSKILVPEEKKSFVRNLKKSEDKKGIQKKR